MVKKKEVRLDGFVTPVSNDISIPLVFLEAQIETDSTFYRHYFAGIFVYWLQYQVIRPWQGLLILKSGKLDLGATAPYQCLLSGVVTRLYLEDLRSVDNLSPNLSLLQLIVVPKSKASEVAQSILSRAQTPIELQKYLDLVETILVNKFPNLSIEELHNMLNLREANVTQTRFYREVLDIGRQEGQQEGEVNLILRLLSRRFGALSPEQISGIRGLSIPQLEFLGEMLLDFQGIGELDDWLRSHRVQE